MHEKVLWTLKRAQIENNFKKNKMELLTKEQQELYEHAKLCYVRQEKFENKYLKDKK